jgi:uncharacterized phage protein gp47/JayE
MLSPSLGSTGLTVLRTADVLDNLGEAIQGSDQYGPEEPIGGDTPLGQILAPVAQQIGLVYELAQALYDALDPDSAEGVVLDSAAEFRGMEREPATYSTIVLTCTGTNGTVIAAGKRARVPDGAIFATNAEATIAPGTTVQVPATCTVTGPEEAAICACTTIVDAVAGWSGVTNAAAAIEGADEETDAALRARMATSGSIGGRTTRPSLRAALLALSSVDAVVVLVNRTLVVDADGVPGKAFEPVVWPAQTPDEAEVVAATIREHLPGGIENHGDNSITVTDAQGDSEVIRYSVASEQVLHWIIAVTKDTDPGAESYPADGDALVDAAVVAYGATLSVGQDVLPVRAAAFILAGYLGSDGIRVDGVPGIRSMIVKVKVGGAPGGGDIVPITMTATQIATTVTANVTVSSS